MITIIMKRTNVAMLVLLVLLLMMMIMMMIVLKDNDDNKNDGVAKLMALRLSPPDQPTYHCVALIHLSFCINALCFLVIIDDDDNDGVTLMIFRSKTTRQCTLV